jgi:tRNA A-37 threonylcarbamoyl transferase component Bud32
LIWGISKQGKGLYFFQFGSVLFCFDLIYFSNPINSSRIGIFKLWLLFLYDYPIATDLYKTPLAIKGVTLVAPGLNVRPSAMVHLINILNELGSDACLVHFSKIHHPDTTVDILEDDILEGYTMARSIAEKHAVPVYFLGYSLGALLGQYFLCVKPGTINFDRQILIAPATAIRLPRLVKSSITLLGDNLKIKSLAPGPYRLDKWLPAKMYKKLMYWERSILNARYAHLNIPTLLIIDPKDELISHSTLVRRMKEFHLTNYQCIILDSNLRGRSTPYHHLVIDEATMGSKNWSDVRTAIRTFLNY